jgi:hypothetical protein
MLPNGQKRLNSEAPEVNFNCLFFSTADELEQKGEEFPSAPKHQARIPLIETDWFTSTAWEELPTSDGVPPKHDEDLGPDYEEHSAESLYELLVASKRRPLAR